MTGKDIIVVLSQNGTALASTTVRSQDIQTAADTIEKSSSMQQDWKEFITGRKEWSITVNYLILAAEKITDLLYVGQTFDITVKNQTAAGVTPVAVTGKTIMTGVKHVATVGTLAQGTFTLKGTGPLTLPASSS